MKGMQFSLDTVQGGEEAEGKITLMEMISNEKTTIWWSGDGGKSTIFKNTFVVF